MTFPKTFTDTAKQTIRCKVFDDQSSQSRYLDVTSHPVLDLGKFSGELFISTTLFLQDHHHHTFRLPKPVLRENHLALCLRDYRQ